VSKFSRQFVNDAVDSVFEDHKEIDIDIFKNHLERYQDLDLLDQGGMKKIHTCYDAFTERELARATLLKEDEDNYDAFINEIRITAMLEHPNIVPIYDIGVENEQVFFTMKKLGGMNLDELIRKNHSTGLSERLDIFLKVCDAVAFAHSKNILHLDIKPANIQVDEYGQVLLCDWGLARNLQNIELVDEKSPMLRNQQHESYLTLNNKLKGTPGYMAPEQINRSFGPRNTRTDIYSLGGVLYFLLCSKDPFHDKSIDEILEQTKKGGLQAPATLYPQLDIPLSLNSIVSKAMNLDNNQRYSNILKMTQDIRAYLEGFITSVEEPSPTKQLKLFVQRNRTLCNSIAVIIIITLILSSLFIQGIKQERNQALAAKEHAEEMYKKSIISEQIATMARNQANLSQEKTLLLVDQLKIADSKSHELRISAAEELMKRAFFSFYKERNYYNATNTIEHILELHPNYPEAQYYYARLLLGASQFAKAHAALSSYKGKRRTDWMIKSCLRFQRANKTWRKPMWQEALEMVESWSSLPYSEHGDLSWHVNSSISQHFSITDCIQYAQARLKSKNRSPHFTFELSTRGNKLQLSLEGNKCQSFEVIRGWPITDLNLKNTDIKDLTILWNLPLKKLKLTGTPINDISHLYHLPLEELHLNGTRVDNYGALTIMPLKILSINESCFPLNQLNRHKELHTLYIPTNTYSKAQIQQLNPSIKVIELTE
jgi:eukaryotic-like serine/threonine-protein kinase